MLKVTAIVVMCFTLAGCGAYRPLYDKGPDGTSAAIRLSVLYVPEQRSRAGQLVRNELLDGVTQTSAPRYELKLNVSDNTLDVAPLSSVLGLRKRYSLSAEFTLFDKASGKLLTSGRSYSNVEYDFINLPVSDLSAADNAQSRAATELGEDIKQRLAAILSSQKG